MKVSLKEDKYGEELSGDPLYEYLKTQILDGHKLLGGRIVVPTKFTHKGPRKVMQIWVQDEKTKKVHDYTYSYNKMIRDLEVQI